MKLSRQPTTNRAPDRTSHVAVLSNPHSERNKTQLGAFRETVIDLGLQERHHELSSMEEIPEVLDRWAAEDVRYLVVNAGDGTFIEVLGDLINRRPFETLPMLTLLPGGMTNLIATDTAPPGIPGEGLQRLMRRLREDRLEQVVRPVLSLRFDPGRPPAHGMFLGAGGFPAIVRFAEQEFHGAGVKHTAAVALTFLSIFGRALTGRRLDPAVFKGEQIALTFDDEPGAPEWRGPALLAMMSTLERFTLGADPFWDEEARAGRSPTEGPIKVTWIADPPRRLALAFAAVFKGRPKKWMREAGYHSRRARRVMLETEVPVLLDGESYTAGSTGRMEIFSEHEVTFVR